MKESAEDMRRSAADRAKEMRGARRTTIGTAFGALLAILLAAGSSIWYIGHLDERDKQQYNRQEADTTAIKSQVADIQTKVTKLPTSEQITNLTSEVRRANNRTPELHDGWFFAKNLSARRRFCRQQSRTELDLLPPTVRSACTALR